MESRKIISREDLLLGIFLSILSFALYIRTLVPTLLTADAAEFQTLSYTLGMTHPSGYTIYVFMGKFFTLIPIKNIAYRVNLMSAFFGAFAVGQVYLIIRKLGGWKIAASAGAIALSVNPLFWRRTIFAETYAPAASMIASIFLLILLWDESKKPLFLFFAGLLGGLSVGIHSTVVMTALAVLIYLLIKARRRVDWLNAAAGATLGLLLFFLAFFYLDWHNPPSSIYNTTYLTNLSNLGLTLEEFDTPLERLFVIFPAEHFWSYYFSAPAEVITERLREYLNFYPRWEFGTILLGAITLFFNKKRVPEALYLLIAFFLVWGFAVTVSFGVYKEFYVPVAVMVHIWLGMGIGAILSGFARLLQRINAQKPFVASLVPSLLGIAFVAAFLVHAKADLSLAIQNGSTTFILEEKIYPFDVPGRYVRLSTRILRKVEDNAIVFDNWDRIYTHIYTAHILEGRTGIAFHEAFPTLGETTLAYIEANIDERPIYFANLHPEISNYYDLKQVGDNLYRLRRK